MPPAVRIVPYQASDLPRLAEFFAQQNPDHPELADPDLIAWQRCDRFLALFQDRIVGHIARLPQQIVVKGVVREVGFGASLVLDTSQPMVQIFAGTALLDQVTKNSPIPFVAVGVVPEIEDTHKKRGYIVRRDVACMFARFLRPPPMLAYLGKAAWYAPPILALNLVRRIAHAPDPSRIAAIQKFDPAWDVLWSEQLSSTGETFAVRTAEFLNYKLSQPGKSYAAFLHNDHSGSPDGYLIIRRAERTIKPIALAKIVDVVGTDAACEALLAHAVRWAMSADVDGVVAIDSIRYASGYAAAGLWVKRPYPVVLPPDLDGGFRVSFLDSDLDHLW